MSEKSIIRDAARTAGIRPALLWGVYGAETNFGKNKNNSSAGAQGPFQFMPATAAGLGIDPHNFKQAAYAAAKYLAQYKNRGTAGMLAAYNAGPAGNPNNPETQAYIPKVKQLAGTWDGAGGDRNSVEASTSRPASRTTTSVSQPDTSAQRQSFLLDYLGDRHDPNALLSLASNLKSLEGLGTKTTTTTSAPSKTSNSYKTKSLGGGNVHPSSQKQLLELFWQGSGGINAKNGAVVPQGFVGGHTDHVHVAANRKAIVKLGKLGQRMGLHVGENNHFGGVAPVHVQNSNHYVGKAIDVSGDPELMRKFAHRVARIYGVESRRRKR